MEETDAKALPTKKPSSSLTDFLSPISDSTTLSNSSEVEIDVDPECTIQKCLGEIVKYCLTCQESSPLDYGNDLEQVKGIPKTFKKFPLCHKCSERHHDGHDPISKYAVIILKIF